MSRTFFIDMLFTFCMYLIIWPLESLLMVCYDSCESARLYVSLNAGLDRLSSAPMEGNHSDSAGQAVYEVVVQSNSTNRSSQFADVALLQTFKPLIIPCYVLVVAVGVVGNYLLLYVICRTRKMHNVTNFFIGNLAFSDMLMCVTCVPFTLAYAFNPHGWVFGRSMCYLVFLIQPVTVYVSVFTLTAIAVDRWVNSKFVSVSVSKISCLPLERFE